jgi:hypothetical protein
VKWSFSRPKTSPSGSEDLGNSEDPDILYSDLCWLLQADSNDRMVLAELVITPDRLLLHGKGTSTLSPAEQDIGRVVQIDVRTSDVELLCVETANTLGLTRIRFRTDAEARTFVARLVEAYQRLVGKEFPQSWLLVHDESHVVEGGA